MNRVEQLYQSESLRVFVPDIIKPHDPVRLALDDRFEKSRDHYGDTYLRLTDEVRKPLAFGGDKSGSNVGFHLMGNSKRSKLNRIQREGFLLPKRYSSFAKTPFFTMFALEEEGSILVYRSHWRWSRELNSVFFGFKDFFVEPMIGIDSQEAFDLCPEAYSKFTSRMFLEETEIEQVLEDGIWSYLPAEHFMGALDLSGKNMISFWKSCKDLTRGFSKGELDEVEAFAALHETSSDITVKGKSGKMGSQEKYDFWQAVGAALTETELLSAAINVGHYGSMSFGEFDLIRPSYGWTREIKEKAIEFLLSQGN